MKKLMWVPVLYIALFAVLLLLVWRQLDKTAVIAIVSVLGGGLAGVAGSFLGAFMSLQRGEREAQVKSKEFASTQALELVKREIALRREAEPHRSILAVAKLHRELYRALLDLYETGEWPKAIEDLGLLDRYDFGSSEKAVEDAVQDEGKE